MVCVEFLTGSSVNNKIVDIKFSAHDMFLEYPSSIILNIEILESPMIYAFTSTIHNNWKKPWSFCTRINMYLCTPVPISPMRFLVRFLNPWLVGVLDKTVCSTVRQFIERGLWLSVNIPDSSTNNTYRQVMTIKWLK